MIKLGLVAREARYVINVGSFSNVQQMYFRLAYRKILDLNICVGSFQGEEEFIVG